MDAKKFDELIKEDVEDKASGWKNVFTYPGKEGFSIKMYQKAIKELNGRTVTRTHSTIKDYSIPLYRRFFKQIEKDGFESNKSIKEFKTLEKEEDAETGDEMMLQFVVSKIPMFSNRENLIRTKIYKVDEGKNLMISACSEEHPDFPVRKGNVRMDLQKFVKLFEEGPDLHAKELTTMDMGGYFPTRLLNMVMAGAVKASIPGMTKQMMAVKEEYLKEQSAQ